MVWCGGVRLDGVGYGQVRCGKVWYSSFVSKRVAGFWCCKVRYGLVG